MHARTKWKAREKESCITARVEAGLMKEAVTFSEENTGETSCITVCDCTFLVGNLRI